MLVLRVKEMWLVFVLSLLNNCAEPVYILTDSPIFRSKKALQNNAMELNM